MHAVVSSPSHQNSLQIKDIYRKVAPTVGSMKVDKPPQGVGRHRDGDLDDPMQSYGSAFVFDAERGIVVTNWHVAKVESQLKVKFGQQTFDVEVVGVEEQSDLAVMKVVGHQRLPREAKRGDPRKLEVGDPVYTIGSPFGLDATLGLGIVSGPPRSRKLGGRLILNMIQHSATVNPGNSGGVLLNERGEIVGINTIILSASGGFEGCALSVPIDAIERSVKKILENGRVTEPSIGLVMAATNHGLAAPAVLPGGPAARAGLTSSVRFPGTDSPPDFKETIFITDVDNISVTDPSELHAALARTRDHPVTLKLKKGPNGTPFSVSLKPDEITVPDAYAIHKALTDKTTTIGPSCEHVRFVSELKPLTAKDIEGILSQSPMLVVLSKPKLSLADKLLQRNREPRTTDVRVYVDRAGALAKLVTLGKGIGWLDEQLQELGFEREKDAQILIFRQSLPSDRTRSLSASLAAVIHGTTADEAMRAGRAQLDLQALPPEIRKRLFGMMLGGELG